MKRSSRWILLSLVIALALAGCVSAMPSTGPTPAASLTSTPALAPTATQTPAPPLTPTVGPTSRVDPDDAVVLRWEREGGVAGFCERVTVYAKDRALVTSCRGEGLKEEYLSDAEMEQVSTWVKTLKPFEHVESDGAVADGMTVRLTFFGEGAQTATEADVQAMLGFAVALLPPPQPAVIAVLQTGVRYVLANEDVTMHAGASAGYPQIGQVFGGQVAWVTGVSADEAWWRVICPDDTVGKEFVWGAYLENERTWDTLPQLMVVYYSLEHELDVRLTTSFDEPALELLRTAGFTETVAAQFGLFHRMAQSVRLHPTTGWETYHDDQAGGVFALWHPPGWTVLGGEMECGIVYGLDSLQLVLFDACWADAANGKKLTFFETYQRFRDAFAGEMAVTKRDVNGVRVEVVQYGEAGDNGVVALDAGPGTVAVWQIGERGFALIDQGNQHLQDGVYDGVLGSFLILGTTWSQPQPVEGYYAPDRRMAFDLPGLPVTVLLPASYGLATNTEYLRRGSFVSFDFTPYGGELPRLAEIQFFSESSLRIFGEWCTSDFCFEGDYPDVERYRAQEAALAGCTDLPPYETKHFGDRCYLVNNYRCTGDACVIREYTTFLGERKVDVWIMMRDTSQVDASDALFALFDIVE